jgi:hypothetical protein
MSWQVQQSIDLGHCDPFRTIADLCDDITGANFTFLQHAEVKPWSAMRDKQCRHSRLIHADTDAVARYARLCHLKYRITNAVSTTDTNFVIRKSLHGEVLAELAETEIITH